MCGACLSRRPTTPRGAGPGVSLALTCAREKAVLPDWRDRPRIQKRPDGQLFRSLPGAGPNLAARLLAEIGDRRERYATANSLQCEAGTAPVTRKSGRSLSAVSFRRACKKPLRQARHLFAGCSIRRCPWAHTLYEQQRSKGKRYHEAVRAVAHSGRRSSLQCGNPTPATTNGSPYSPEAVPRTLLGCMGHAIDIHVPEQVLTSGVSRLTARRSPPTAHRQYTPPAANARR